MSKGLKTLYSLLGIVLLTLLYFVIATSQTHLNLPNSFKWLDWNWDMPRTMVLGMYNYLFWGAIVLFLIILFAVLVIIFYPRTYTEVRLEKNKGSLLLKKSAIEGYVRSAIKTTGLMENPSVTAKLYKKKFKVDVKGRLSSRVGVSDQVKGLEEGITTGFNEFFGLDKPVDFKVYVKDIDDSEYFGNQSESRQRVE